MKRSKNLIKFYRINLPVLFIESNVKILIHTLLRVQPVRKPLGDRSSAAARKFPAAEFTRMSSLPKCLIVDSRTLTASSLLRTSPSSPIACNKNDTF
jgi:hypothetical protein